MYAVEMPINRSFDIDTEEDFLLMEYVLNKIELKKKRT